MREGEKEGTPPRLDLLLVSNEESSPLQAAADDAVKNAKMTPSALKFAMFRSGMQAYTEERLANLDKLTQMKLARGGGGGRKAPPELERTPSKQQLAIEACKLREAFFTFEETHEGALDPEGLAAILSRTGAGRSAKTPEEAKAKVDQIMKEFDASGDGKLQVEEFVQWWKSTQLPIDKSCFVEEDE